MGVLENKNLYIFDIDRTLITSYNSDGKLIWLKNMQPPFEKINDDTVKDAKGSAAFLHQGTREMLFHLFEQNKDIGFLSAGSLPNVEYDLQPSVKIMKMFDIYLYFNSHKILEYKTVKKEEHLKNFEDCVFFDDDEKHIVPAYKLDNVTVIDRKSFTDWRQLL
jgi:predicted phosphatase